MQIRMVLNDTNDEVEVDLPAVPQIGSEILWVDEATDGHGGTYQRMRTYRVRMVDWSVSASEPKDPDILLRLDFLADTGGEIR